MVKILDYNQTAGPVWERPSPERWVHRTQKGISKKTVEEISYLKGEPDWMREKRLLAYRFFEEKKLPLWGVDLSELNFGDITFFIRPEMIAKQRGKTQFFHQRPGKLLVGVREDHNLRAPAKFVQERLGAGQRPDPSYHRLNIPELEFVITKDLEATFHQGVVIGDIASSETQITDPCFFGHFNPNFRNKNAFQIQTTNNHNFLDR